MCVYGLYVVCVYVVCVYLPLKIHITEVIISDVAGITLATPGG